MLRRLSTWSVCLALLVAPRPAPAQAPDEPATAEADEPATAEADEPATAEAEVETPAAETEAIGPIVHFSLRKPDGSRGVLKLARLVSATAAAVGNNTILYTTRYNEICTDPCGVPVDVSERPIFFFIRDGQAVTRGFRLNDLGDEITVRVKPTKTGLLIAGVTLAMFVVGIPMWIAATPKVWASPGRPGQSLSFRKLKRAR